MSIIFLPDGILLSCGRPRPTPPLYCAVAFSVVGLLITVKAAPIMLGLYLRGSVDTLAFLATVWAFSRLTAAGDAKSLDAPLIATERRNS